LRKDDLPYLPLLIWLSFPEIYTLAGFKTGFKKASLLRFMQFEAVEGIRGNKSAPCLPTPAAPSAVNRVRV
jgi:hypothetical protein